LRCLGSFELAIDEHVIDLAGVPLRARSLLWYLAMRGGRPVARQQLAAALWSDCDEAAARRGLHVAVSLLGTATSIPGWAGRWSLIDRSGDGYRVALGPGDVRDVEAFDGALHRARSVRARDERVVVVEEALALYRGDLLPEAGPAEWVAEERHRLRLAAADAALEAAVIRYEDGHLDAAVRSCEKGLVTDRHRDDLWLLLVQIREAQGDRAAASRARCAHVVVLAELGL
jgi:DNA-binding SARP family transcriptional activator